MSIATRPLLALAAALTLHGHVNADDEPSSRDAEPSVKAERPALNAAKLGRRPPPVDPMQDLRDRLAAKLGATKGVAAGKTEQVMQVSTQSDGHLQLTTLPDAEAKAAAVKATNKPKTRRDSHWSYDGDTGPQAWAGLKPEFSQCGNGKRQSPIDIRDGIRVDLEPVQVDYKPSAFGVLDNGHTVQVNIAPGNWIEVMGRRFELVQFHFHRPSEERIEGKQFDMVAHLVHKDVGGRLAVIAVLLERGSAHPLVQTVWNNLPLEQGDEVSARGLLDIQQLLPNDTRYYTYMGSLTTPPCSEGVLWIVMQQPVQLSPEQIDVFAHLYPMNARPPQQAAGRLIKQSN